MIRGRFLVQVICLITLSLLTFGWKNISAVPSSQDEAEIRQLDLKWLTTAPSLVGFDQSKLESAIENIGHMAGVYSVIVVRNNYLVLERYFRDGYRLKPHNLKSATKSVLSALIGLAENKGYLWLDQPISDFLPQVKNLNDPRKADITVRHLLTMTSGLEPTSYQAYNSWVMHGEDWLKTILDRPLVAGPGTKHQYSTGDTHILSAVLTAATRMSTRKFAEHNLFEPLGINVNGWEIDPQGINQGGNNLSLIPLDMALFGQLYLDGGIYRNRQIIPKWWIDVSTRPNYLGEHEVYGRYGFLWYSRPGGVNAFVAVGYGGQYIYVSPEYNCVSVITSTLVSKGRAWEKELFGYIRNGILGSILPQQQELLQVDYDGNFSPQFYQTTPITSEAVSSEKHMGLTIANLNLRSGPSRNSQVITLLDAGTVLVIQGQKNSWLKVQAVNLTGWVSAKYVRFVNQEKIRFAKRQPAADGTVKQKSLKEIQKLAQPAPEISPQNDTFKKSQEFIRQLQSRLEVSEKIKQQLEDDLDVTRKKMAAEQQTTSQLATARKMLAKELAEMHIQNDTQDTTIKTLQNKRDSLEAELAAQLKELAAQQEIAFQSESTKKNLEKELTAYHAQVEELQKTQSAAIGQANKTRKQLEQELISKRGQLKALEKQLRESKTGGEEVAAKLDKMNTDFNNQQQAKAKLEASRKTLEAEFASQQTRIAALTENLNSTQTARDALAKELDGLQKKMAAQQETAAQTASAKRGLAVELAAAQTQIEGLIKKQQEAVEQAANTRKQLAQKLTAKQAQLDAVQTQLQESQASAQVMLSKLTKISQNLEKQKKAKSQSEDIRKSLETELAGLQQQVVEQADKLTTIESQGVTFQAELAAVQKELAARQNIALQTESVKKSLEAELASSRRQIEELQTALTVARTAREDQAREFAMAIKELESQRQIAAQAETMYRKLAIELASANQQIDSYGKAIPNLESANKSLDKELATARNQIITLETALKTAPELGRKQEVQTAMVEQAQNFPKPQSEISPVPIQSQEKIAPKTEKAKNINVAAKSVEKLQTISSPVKNSPDLAMIESFVRSWTAAWEQKNVDGYLAHYSKEFDPPDSISLAAWYKQRRQRLRKPAFIEIDIQNIQQKRESDSRVQVTFTQKYQSNTYRDKVVKTLYLLWEKAGWAIVRETSKAM